MSPYKFKSHDDSIVNKETIENMHNTITVPDRVHIIPLGYEKDRILEPVQDLKADKVILLIHRDDEDLWSRKEVKGELQESPIKVEERDCDIFDMYGTIGTIADIIDNHSADDVYVNLATGSKVTAIGGMIACMLTEATPYYVRAEKYGPENEEGPPSNPVSRGVKGIDNLPSFHIDEPPAEQIRALEFISNAGAVRKSQLIEFGEENQLPFLRDHSTANRTGKYRLLDSHIINPLTERGEISVEQVGRRSEVEITEAGENTLRAFDYLL